jgi:hypothetical protein
MEGIFLRNILSSVHFINVKVLFTSYISYGASTASRSVVQVTELLETKGVISYSINLEYRYCIRLDVYFSM